MPWKYHHYIPFNEDNIPSVDHFLSRPLKTPIFALALVAHYVLEPMRKINIEPMPIGALSQLSTRATLLLEIFLKKEAKFRLQQLRGWVSRSGFDWITTAFLLWSLVSTIWGTSQRIRPPFHYCRDPNLLLYSINIAFIHWWRGGRAEGLNGWVSKSLHSLKYAARALIVLIVPNP